MNLRFALRLLLILCSNALAIPNTMSNPTEHINWLRLESTLKHAHYPAQQIEEIIETLHQAEEYGLTTDDLQTDAQILSQAKYIFEFKNGSLKWKLIAGACVVTAIAAIIAAVYFECRADSLEKKYKKKVSELKEHARELKDLEAKMNNQHQELSHLMNDMYEARLKNRRKREELCKELRAYGITEEKINSLFHDHGPLIRPDMLALE